MRAFKWWCDVGRSARRSRSPSSTNKSSMCIHHAALSKYKIQMNYGAIIARCSLTTPCMIRCESFASCFSIFLIFYCILLHEQENGIQLNNIYIYEQTNSICTMYVYGNKDKIEAWSTSAVVVTRYVCDL